jgi:hypothetical protein
MDALHMTVADLFDDVDKPANNRAGNLPDQFKGERITNWYIYTDISGNPTHAIGRTPTKQFPAFHYGVNGWSARLGSGPRFLYRAVDLANAKVDDTIYLVEGEKDVDAIRERQGIATTVMGGARALKHTDLSMLHGHAVTAIVDADDSGESWAQDVRDLLGEKCDLTFAKALTGKDAFDHLQAGHTLSDFVIIRDPVETAILDSFLDIDQLLQTDLSATPWITPNLLAPGAQISLVGSGKVGKSLFMMEWSLCMATGQPFLGFEHDRPYTVLYLDYENSLTEIQRRLRTLGFTEPGSFQNLRYASFPLLRPLDTNEGAEQLIRIVEVVKPDVVVIDTVSRTIDGPEDKSDTWIAFYRKTLLRLKALGVAVVRLDHFGKDQDRGSRGSSAKTQDIDHEWTLTEHGVRLLLKRTYTRNGIGMGEMILNRTGHPTVDGSTKHEIVHHADLAQLTELEQWAEICDDAGLKVSAGRDTVRQALKDAGLKVANAKLSMMLPQLARLRKDIADKRIGQGHLDIEEDE